MSTTVYILLGLFITFSTYFLIIWGFMSIYYFVSKDDVSFAKNLQVTSFLAVVGFVSNILLMILFSALNIYLFAVIITLVSFGLYLVLLKYYLKFKSFDALIVSTTMAVILNPAWLRLLGIL